ncbi:unnamed protein product [Amaranthus hypochondriacus]
MDKGKTKHDDHHHDDHEKKDNKHVCDICDQSFSSGQALGGHKRKHYFKNKNNPNQTLIETHMIVSGSNTGQRSSQTEPDGNAPPMEAVRGEDIYYDEIIKKIRKNTEGLEKYDDDEIYFLQEELGLTIPPYKPCFLNKKKKLNLDDPILKEALNLTQVNDSDSNSGSSTENTHTN